VHKPPWERRTRHVDLTVGVAVAVLAVTLVAARPGKLALPLPAVASPTTAATPATTPVTVAPLRTPPPRDVPTGRLPDTLSRVPTTDPVVFLTIDDGYTRDPAVVAQLRQARVPVSLFLVESQSRAGEAYFSDILATGATVQNHTRSHLDLRGLTVDRQAEEICGATTVARQVFGRTPTLFRPPFGYHDATTSQAAARCGFSTMVLWEATVNDGVLRIQGGRDRLLPGDIILMHFRPDLSQNLSVVFAALAAEGLGVGRLEDYVN